MPLYGSFLGKALNKEINWTSDTIKVMLLTNAYIPNQDTHDYLDDVIAHQVIGTGYVAGGATLANKTKSYDPATNVDKYDADDVNWANSTITARYAVIYDDTPATNATKPLVGFIDFGADKSSTGGDFTIVWNAGGIFTLTVGA